MTDPTKHRANSRHARTCAKALRGVVRPVLEELERRQLLAWAPIGTPFSFGSVGLGARPDAAVSGDGTSFVQWTGSSDDKRSGTFVDRFDPNGSRLTPLAQVRTSGQDGALSAFQDGGW